MSEGPVLLCFDLQRAQAAAGGGEARRRGSVREADILRSARGAGWTVSHTFFDAPSVLEALFGPPRPAPGLEPRADEPVFVRQGLSAYSSGHFAEFMEEVRARPILVVAYHASTSLLATLFDAHARGHRFHVEAGVECSLSGAAPAAFHRLVSLDVAQALGMRLVRAEAPIGERRTEPFVLTFEKASHAPSS